YETDLGYEAVIKYSQGDAREFIFSQTPQETNSISAMQKPEMLNISQNLVFNKQFSYEHTSTLTANYTHKKNDNNNNWLFDEPIFSGIIPFVAEDTLNFIQNTNSLVNKARFRLKHYWVLDNKNHIYPVLGLNFNDWNYSTHDFQRLQNGDINSFQDEGFNNRLDFRLVDAYVGFEYKRKLGEIILKPGLVYHYFLWNIQQFGTETANREKGVLLPKIEAEYEISSAKKFRFNYRMATGFSNVSRYADRLRLAGFNQLYRGNADSENELRHQFSLTYYHFNLFKGTFLNAGANYSRKTKSVQETTVLEGIDQIQTAIYSDLPQNSFSLNGTFSKQVGNFKFSLGGNAAIADYSRIVNEVRNNYLSQNYSYTFKTETSFDSFPNFEIGFRQHFNIFESDQDVSGLKNEFMRLDPYFYLDYDFWNGFILKADYFYNYYENKNTGQTNRFQIAGASIYYNKENSPWGFEIRVENLFDVRYKNKNSFSQFLVLDKNIYIQPRTMLFVLSYKL
ncbi:MAG TPA: hypothetical protein VK010_02245, partial [Flavobacteriaceae bacterium]|nr:hypothetical protein [Flavobacteriaceae bacterium]